MERANGRLPTLLDPSKGSFETGEGQPAAGATVKVLRLKGGCFACPPVWNLAANVKTDESGGFETPKIETGQYVVRAGAYEGYQWSADQSVQVRKDEVSSVELTLRPFPQSLDLEAEEVTEDGRPLIRVQAKFTNSRGQAIDYLADCGSQRWFSVRNESGELIRASDPTNQQPCPEENPVLEHGANVQRSIDLGVAWDEDGEPSPLPPGEYEVLVKVDFFVPVYNLPRSIEETIQVSWR